MPWDFIVAMPAAALPNAVDAGDTAVVPFADARYQELIATQDHVRRFLESFRTAFGRQLQPSIVIRDHDAERIQSDDLAALRNMIALAAVVKARTDRCVQPFGGLGPVYADLFEMYPVNLATDREAVVVRTASEFGMDDLRHFQGQPHPGYIYPNNVTPEFDDTLLAPLVRLWQSRPVAEREEQFRRRVFRSLEAAYHALIGPFMNLGTDYDHALAFSLWVSAFEILASRRGNVSADDIEKLILKVRWSHQALHQDAVESVRGPRPGRPVRRPVQVYERLYRVRNEGLHGGTLSTHLVSHRLGDQEEDPLAPEPLAAHHWNHLHVAVPALYRGVLLHLLAKKGFHAYPEETADLHDRFWEDRTDQHYEAPLILQCLQRRRQADA